MTTHEPTTFDAQEPYAGYENFYGAQDLFLKQCEQLTHDPANPEVFHRFNDTAVYLNTFFEEAVEGILVAKSNRSEQIITIYDLLIEEFAVRSKRLSALSECPNYTRLARMNQEIHVVDNEPVQVTSVDEDFLDKMSDVHRTYFQTDVNHFLDHLSGGPYIHLIADRSRFGSHVLQVCGRRPPFPERSHDMPLDGPELYGSSM